MDNEKEEKQTFHETIILPGRVGIDIYGIPYYEPKKIEITIEDLD